MRIPKSISIATMLAPSYLWIRQKLEHVCHFAKGAGGYSYGLTCSTFSIPRPLDWWLSQNSGHSACLGYFPRRTHLKRWGDVTLYTTVEKHFCQDWKALWVEFPWKYVTMGIPEITKCAKAENSYTAITVIKSLLCDLDGPWGDLQATILFSPFRSSVMTVIEESHLWLIMQDLGFSG